MVYERNNEEASGAIDADDLNDIEPIDINEYWDAPMPSSMIDLLNNLINS